jgi:hypothetical protein
MRRADTVLEGLEKEAREAKKGLWVDPAPIPPWVYRKARRGQSLDLSDLVPLDAETKGNTATRAPPLLGAIESAPGSSSSPYPVIGNRRTMMPHTAVQDNLELCSKKVLQYSSSECWSWNSLLALQGGGQRKGLPSGEGLCSSLQTISQYV